MPQICEFRILKVRPDRRSEAPAEELFKPRIVTKIIYSNRSGYMPPSSRRLNRAYERQKGGAGRVATSCIKRINHENPLLLPGPIEKHIYKFIIDADFVPQFTETPRTNLVDGDEDYIAAFIDTGFGE